MLTIGLYSTMSSMKISSSKVILAFLGKSQIVKGFSPDDAREIQIGRKLVDRVDENCGYNENPFKGLDLDDKRKLMAYVVLKRENPILEDKDNLNYEAAVNSLKEDTYDNEKELERKIVEQASRLSAFFKHTLEMDDNGKVKIKKGDK